MAATGNGAVVAVHHMGKDRATVRGSSALEAGADVVFAADGADGKIRLRCTKRKDGPAGPDLRLDVKPYLASCVVESGLPAGLDDAMGVHESAVVRCLQNSFKGQQQVTASLLRDAAGVPKNRFYEALQTLEIKGFVRRVPKPGGRGATVHVVKLPGGQEPAKSGGPPWSGNGPDQAAGSPSGPGVL